MEGNTFARPSSHHVLTILVSIFLAISSICSACDDTSAIIPTNSTKTNFTYTAIPSNNNTTQTNSYENTTIPSNNTTPTNNYENTTIPSNNYENTTIPSNNTTPTNSYENTTIPSNNTTQTFMTYIKNSCNSATYPSICYESLSPYASKIEADPLKLCNVSLSLALKAAHSASSTISKLLNSNDNNMTGTAEQIVQDCFGNVKDSIGELKDSLDAMSHLGDTYIDKDFQISNIKTWVSAAITNDQTCYDGFDEMNVDPTVRDKIRQSVLDVARKTSNALYFINNNIY